jgi:hypothetical protein
MKFLLPDCFVRDANLAHAADEAEAAMKGK